MKMIMKKVYEAFPELEEKSLDIICKDGLRGILRTIRCNEDLSIDIARGPQFILYKPESPKAQWERLCRNVKRRARAKLNKENGSEQKNA